MKGSKPMFFKLCTLLFTGFFLIIFLLELKHGVVQFKEPRQYILIPEIVIAFGLVAFSFREIAEEWKEGKWFWRR